MLERPILRYTKEVHCPICDLRLVMVNGDLSGLCPLHGEISSADHFYWKDLSRVERLIEIRAKQIRHEIGLLVQDARDSIYGHPRLCQECCARWDLQGFLPLHN